MPATGVTAPVPFSGISGGKVILGGKREATLPKTSAPGAAAKTEVSQDGNIII